MNSIEKLKQAIPQVDSVALNLIRTDGETQYRENIDEGVVRDYLDAMKDNVEFPPIEAVFDGEFYWLTDGFHRLAALKKLRVQRPEVSFISGTQADAQLLALSANGSHGLPRSVMTKHRIGLMAISHPALQDCSNYEIAKFCGLSAPFIQSLRNPSVKLRQQDARDRSALKRIKIKVSNLCSLYRFTDAETYEFPKLGVKAMRPTNEWKRFKTLAEAKIAIKKFTRKNTSKLRPSNRSDSIIKSEDPDSDSTSEQVGDLLLRLSNKEISFKTKLEAS